MSDPHKPSQRVLYLMGFAERGRIFGNVWERADGRHYSMRILRPEAPFRLPSERNPSQRELIHMLTFNLCELRADPSHDTIDTQTGRIAAPGMRVYLTGLGRKILKEAFVQRFLAG